MSETVADFLLKRLMDRNIHRIYGFPGDGINGILGALERSHNKPRLIQVRHEEMAAFMACAHAKFTGEVGVCLATSGPGAVHLLNGLYDAKMDHQPVVAIVGQAARAIREGVTSKKSIWPLCSKMSRMNLSIWLQSPHRSAIWWIARSASLRPSAR